MAKEILAELKTGLELSWTSEKTDTIDDIGLDSLETVKESVINQH